MPIPKPAPDKLIEIANGVGATQDGRIYTELVNSSFLTEFKGAPDEYRAGIRHAFDRGWIVMHEGGTHLRVTQTGAELVA